MVRGDLDPKVEARLREVLIEAAGDPDAREALLQFFKTTRFLPIDADAAARAATTCATACSACARRSNEACATGCRRSSSP